MRRLLYLCVYLMLFSRNTISAENAYTVIEDQAKIPILTPSFSERKTEKIRLENGLEAYIISDPKADQSSAVMTVKTGSWEDPPESPGMAHFLEHMLFLGTKKYPQEASYSRFISEHDGQSNAFTANHYTCYLFSINHNAFQEALDRFSYFFKEPLFNPSGVDRELQAIDQEYAKNLENDDFRELFVYKALSSPSHPNHAFNIGNKATLSHVSRESLMEWYHKHYSANQMRLIVVSSEPLDALKEMVVKDFSGIPDIQKGAVQVSGAIAPNLPGNMVYIAPVKNKQELSLMWEMPARFSKMKDEKPDSLICHVLGHEGEGSLLEDLKKEKLAEELQCGSFLLGPDNLYFILNINLTTQGVKNVETVLKKCFQAIQVIQSQGIPGYIFDEVQRMNILDYQYQPREDEFTSMMKWGSYIANEDISTFPEQTLIIKKFDPTAIQDFVSYLIPQNCTFTLLASPEVIGVALNQHERWLGADYTVQKIPEKTLKEWQNVDSSKSIHLSVPNLFLPAKLTLLPSLGEKHNSLLPQPEVIFESEKGRVFFAQDTRYLMPQISWTFQCKTPEIESGNAAKVVLGDLYVKALKDSLAPVIYPALLAGMTTEISRFENGVAFKITGYSDHASDLWFDLWDRLQTIEVSSQKFKIYKESLSREYQSGSSEEPIKQVLEQARSVLYKNFCTNKQKAAAIQKIDFDKFKDFCSKVFQKVYVQSMLYGNVSREQADGISRKLFGNLDKEMYPKKEQFQSKIVVLPENEGPFYATIKSKSQGNALFLAIEALPFSFKSLAAQSILMQGMKEPFFSTLRTKQQTGYIVFSSSEEIEKFLFNFFLVQSNTHEGRDLLARFELFIEDFLQEITKSELTQERFEGMKSALLTTLKQPPKNISEMGAELSRLAFKYDADFHWLDKQVQGMEELTYPEFLKLAQSTLGKGNKRRLGIFLKGKIPSESAIQYTESCGLSSIRNSSTYENAN